MTRSAQQLLTALLLLSATAWGESAMGKDVDIEVSASRQSLYLEESLILSVKVSGSDSKTEPDLSAIQDCDVKFLGGRSQNYSSTTWINGKMTRTGFRGRLYTYNVTPKRTGRIQLGPVVARVGNVVKTAPGPTITVTGIEEQDDVLVKVSASRDTVLVDESFEVKLDIYIKCLDTPDQDTERLLGSRPPHLAVPYLTLSPIDGLEHTDVRALLQNMIVRRDSKPSFTLNNYASRRDPFDFDSMFNFNEARRSTPDRFAIPVKKITRNGKPYWHYQVQTKYIAREERTHTFGPVLFKGGIIETINAAKRVTLEEIFAVGPSQTVRVVPPPEEGRPPSFVGAIGTNMIVDASLDAQNCRVGDPLTLSLSISGGVNLKNIYPPNLSEQASLLKQFRLYEDTLSVDRGPEQVTFSYTVRPTEAGTLEVPAISLSYFDSGVRTYRTVKTAPIPVTAAEAGDLDVGMILGGDTNRIDLMQRDQDSSLTYVAPFLSHPATATATGFGFGLGHAALLVISPLVFLAALAVKPTMRVRRTLGRESERKSIYRRTLKDLKRAQSLPPNQASSQISTAILAYVAHRFDRNADALTPPDLASLLGGAGLTSGSHRDLIRIASAHFNASFSDRTDGDLDFTVDSRRASEIVAEMEALRRSSGAAALPLLIIIVLMGIGLAARGADEDESQFLWRKAWSRTLSAATPEDYAKAADDYRELAAAGIRNKLVFYNMGTALLMAGDKPSALRAFERAERYGGADARTIYNIRLAGSEFDEELAALPWVRIVLFWHYALPVVVRMNIAVAAWVVLFVMLTMGTRRKTQGYRILFGITAVVLIIFGSSTLTSAFQEHKDRIRDTYISQKSLGAEVTE